MSAAHLHAVPDPDPEPDEAPGLGEGVALAPAVVAPRPSLDDELPGDDQDDSDEDLADEDDLEERPSLLKELQPYYDPRPLAELGPLAVEVGKAAGPPLLRGIVWLLRSLVRAAVWYARGTGVLLAALAGWLGKSGEARARLGGAAAALYGLVHLSGEYPYVWPLAGAALALAVLLAAAGLIKAPKPEKKDTKKGSEAKDKGAPAASEKTEEKTAETPEEDASKTTRKSLFARFLKARQEKREMEKGNGEEASEEGPGNTPEEAPGNTLEEEEEEAEIEVSETPREHPLTALIRKEIGAENGVHLQDLRPAMREALPGLAGATDKELRTLLTQAGWDPTRTFRARGVAGRAGVHRDQLPPLPSPKTGPAPSPVRSPRTGEGVRPANSSALSAALRTGGEWTEEEKARGFRAVPDPERGPSGARIEHYGGDQK
ncbi:hypothetical protein [Streptomyces cinereoruber]|uniref:hypothetical protein n=1 Tax=Streptomyces cinereoruber TaxID=67260 RepID=UPI003638FB64